MESKSLCIAGCGQLLKKIVVLFALTACCISPLAAQPDDGREKAIKHLRGVMEQPFLETGGFSEFDCSITSAVQPTNPFTCDAAIAAGKHYQYLLVPDPEEGLIVDLITEPAAQLDYEWLPALEAACKQFLDQFNQADWENMYAGFNPNLQKLVSVSKLEADLGPLRGLLGQTGEPVIESYSLRAGGRNELQFSAPAKSGEIAFRCGLNVAENDVTILAYLITPYPGTPLYQTGLEEDGIQQLSNLIGKKVTQLEIPYSQLPNAYDSAEGVAVLTNGKRVKLRVTRSGRLDDFSEKDYTFSVLED